MAQFRMMNAAGSARTPDQFRMLAAVEPLTELMAGSFTYKSRSGNEGVTFDPQGINSIGMGNPGIEGLRLTGPVLSRIAHNARKRFRLSAAGDTTEELVALAKVANEIGVDIFEINFGCPNVLDAGHADIWSFHPERMKSAIISVRRVFRGEIGLKFSLFSDPALLARVGEMVKEIVLEDTLPYGKFELVLSNTFPKGILYDLEPTSPRFGKPVIDPDGGLGGVSGDFILPLVLGQKEQFFRILGDRVLYITVGGIGSGWALAQHICAKSDGVQIGTAFYSDEDPRVFTEILEQLAEDHPQLAEQIA